MAKSGLYLQSRIPQASRKSFEISNIPKAITRAVSNTLYPTTIGPKTTGSYVPTIPATLRMCYLSYERTCDHVQEDSRSRTIGTLSSQAYRLILLGRRTSASDLGNEMFAGILWKE